MQKKRRLQIKSDETTIHIVGQERFVSVQKYVGDLPDDEPTDWFPQSDELARYAPDEADELLNDEWLIDEF